MLNWLSSKLKTEKSGHPLGTDAGIAEFIENLTPGRPETNLIELADWLADPQQLANLSADKAIRAIIRLDETAQPFLQSCWNELLGESQVDHLVEQKLKALDTYYQAAASSYVHALSLLAKAPAAAGSNLPAQTGLFAQRAMAALAGRQRIMHIRYRTPDPAWWDAVGAALNSAQAGNVINLKQRNYADDAGPSSPWVEYLLALFFESAPLGNLLPQQMDLLHRVLRWLEPHFMVQNGFSPQAPYVTRLDKPGPAQKLNQALDTPGAVYFGPGLGYGQLVRLRAALKQSGDLPEWMRSSRCPFDKALAVIDALIMHWSERPPERRFKRERREAKLLVVNGFSQLRRMIAFSEFARSGRKVGYKTHLEMLKFERFGFADTTREAGFDQEKWENATPLETIRLLETTGFKQMMDEWTMQDFSESGLGATAPFLKPWLVIGSYMGFRLDEEVDWRLGIVRRIHRLPSGHPSVGVETLQETPHCAQILPMRVMPGIDPWSLLHKDDPNERLQDAVVLSMSDTRMLIPPGIHEENGIVALILSGSRVPVRLKSVVHRNADCDCVQYEFCEKGVPVA